MQAIVEQVRDAATIEQVSNLFRTLAPASRRPVLVGLEFFEERLIGLGEGLRQAVTRFAAERSIKTCLGSIRSLAVLA